MNDPERMDPAPWDDPDTTPTGIGPPGWEEFSGARERFMRTLALASLEGAWAAPSREPNREWKE
jgi:hypothetical protein